MTKIVKIDAYQIYDSRGNPTVEAEVTLENGIKGVGLVPSGASKGQYEAHELRDNEPAFFKGKSVLKAVNNVRTELQDAIGGMDVRDQRAIDEAMIARDGTPNKNRLGANAILGVSMAVANAAANARGIPLYQNLGNGKGCVLPLPEIQVIGGGAHANWRTDLQDWMVVATGARNYAEVMEITFNVFHSACEIMKARGAYYGAADEGGLWPDFKTNEEAFDLFMEAVVRAGYTPGKEVSLSLDIAASDLFDSETKRYHFRMENRILSSDAFIDQMIEWCNKYPVVSIEDPAADDDWSGWERFYKAMGHRVQIIGDDLFTTNSKRITEGIEKGIANAVLIKLNQIGSVTETMDAIRQTQAAGWAPVVSARSGETEDAFITHLSVATNSGQLKVGSFTRSERMVKWNEVIRIERQLGELARYNGADIRGIREAVKYHKK
jgi:enolase